MISESELLFGQTDPLPAQTELFAGPVSLVFEDGCIHYLRYGGREILRRVYGAIRDHEWRTIPGTIHNLKIEKGDGTFRITFLSEHQLGFVDYVWKGSIEGSRDGTIRFQFEGESRSAFRRNRIGFCILHPPEAVIGSKCKASHADGSVTTENFPETIAPAQPVGGLKDLKSISFEISPATWVTTEFEGDVFETEDQRNWGDDSFKTYCTPSSLPLPVEVWPGDRVRQSVTIKLEGQPKSHVTLLERKPIQLTVGSKSRPLPKIGFSSAGTPLAFSAQMRLQQLKPAHIRVEAPMSAPDWQQSFADGFRDATALKTKVELALRLTGCPGEDLRDLVTTYPEPFQHWAFTSSFARILLSTFGEPSTSKRSLEAFRGFLLKTGLSTLDVPTGAGAEGDLYDFNSQRPPGDADLFFWSMNPQVHAFDIASISETPAGLAAQLRSVQNYFGDAPKAVSPITLRPRGGEGSVDPHQKSLFGAVWTLGMISALTEAGASSATFFETTGDKGVMENGGAVFPMYHVLRAVAGAREALECHVSDRFSIAALALRIENGIRIIVGNYMRTSIELDLPSAPNAVIRQLNKETAVPALEQPDSLWSPTAATPLDEGPLRLAPFEIAFIDQPILPDAF
jgi:hypothetical protein